MCLTQATREWHIEEPEDQEGDDIQADEEWFGKPRSLRELFPEDDDSDCEQDNEQELFECPMFWKKQTVFKLGKNTGMELTTPSREHMVSNAGPPIASMIF
jgi:hypothetical protein